MAHKMLDQHRVALVQLPFPSQTDPLPPLDEYYSLYQTIYNQVISYDVGNGDLWEAPIWIAHLDGAIGRADTVHIDLSRSCYDVSDCVRQIVGSIEGAPTVLFFSPLAQNFTLACEVSRTLIREGYKTVVGGNMAELATLGDYSTVYSGIARRDIYDRIMNGSGSFVSDPVTVGRQQRPLGYRPSYRLLDRYSDRVPLVRINASHGCLYGCTFCGDGWSKQLHEVPLNDLQAELDEIRSTFPNTRLLYIGDKTFGQSKQSVNNLLSVVDPSFYTSIVQTHVHVVDEELIDSMCALGVKVVEMGFESGSAELLARMKKGGSTRDYVKRVEQLNRAGLNVILNIIGGLPYETRSAHIETLRFLEETASDVWLYNLYNFVPYPKTPIYPIVKKRIIDWNWENWREDRPVVFDPMKLSRDELWRNFLSIVEFCTSLLRARVTEVG